MRESRGGRNSEDRQSESAHAHLYKCAQSWANERDNRRKAKVPCTDIVSAKEE